MYLTLPLAHLHESLLISNQPKYGFVCHSDIYTSKLSVYIRVGLGEMQIKRKPPKTQLT